MLEGRVPSRSNAGSDECVESDGRSRCSSVSSKAAEEDSWPFHIDPLSSQELKQGIRAIFPINKPAVSRGFSDSMSCGPHDPLYSTFTLEKGATDNGNKRKEMYG